MLRLEEHFRTKGGTFNGLVTKSSFPLPCLEFSGPFAYVRNARIGCGGVCRLVGSNHPGSSAVGCKPRCGTLPNRRWDSRVTLLLQGHTTSSWLSAQSSLHISHLCIWFFTACTDDIHIFCNCIFSERLQSFCFISTVSIVSHFSTAPLMSRVIGVSTL